MSSPYPPSQKTKFFVANMKYEFTEEDVKEWFSVSGFAWYNFVRNRY